MPETIRSRSSHERLRQSAESPVPCGVFFQRLEIQVAVEVRPVFRNEHQLRIGCLPEKEIRQPLLAAGADDQVGIGNAGGIQARIDRLRVDIFRPHPARRHVSSQPGGNAGDLVA